MPLQDDPLREVWASDRSGRHPHTHLDPGGPEAWVGRRVGKGEADPHSFATLSGHEEEGQSPEVQRRPKQVCHPAWKGGRKTPNYKATQGGDPGAGRVPLSGLWGCLSGVFL